MWTNEYSQLMLNGYLFYNFPRKIIDPRAKRASGGISIFIKQELCKCVTIEKQVSENVVWLRLHNLGLTDKDYCIGVVYIPPETSTHSNVDIFTVLSEDIFNLSSFNHVFLCGDFNARTGMLSDVPIDITGNDVHIDNCGMFPVTLFSNDTVITQQRVSQDKQINSYGRELIDICKSLNMFIVNGRIGKDSGVGSFTRSDTTGSSVVDYLLCSTLNFNIILDFEVDTKLPESDHLPLVYSILIQQESNTRMPVSQINCANSEWQKYVTDSKGFIVYQDILKSDLRQNELFRFKEAMSSCENVNIVSKLCTDILITSADRVFPKTKIKISGKTKSRPPLWFDIECKELRNKLIQAQKHKLAGDTEIIPSLTKQYRALKQRKIRNFKSSFYDKLDDCNENDQVQMWSLLKPYLKKKNTVNISNDEFYSVFSKIESSQINENIDLDYQRSVEQFLLSYEDGTLDDCCTEKNIDEILNSNITFEEVNSVIKVLKSNKSPGLDAITADFIKYCPENLIHELVNLFNYIIEKREYPDEWVIGARVPVPKVNKAYKVEQYRQITILPVFTKIFESVICNRFTFVNEAYSLQDNFNGGFLRGSRTIDNILILLGSIQSQLAKRENLYVCFVDFSRAFDQISRTILFYKMVKQGFGGRVLDTLRNMYSKTKSKVRTGNILSSLMENIRGVNQGGVLSPFLFRKYLADMKSCFDLENGIKIDEVILAHLLWADDLILFSGTAEGLQKHLDSLYEFCRKNQLIVNTTKTKVMIFGPKSCMQNVVFKFNEGSVDIVKEYKYLGVVISSVQKLNGNIFKNHFIYISEKASKAMYTIVHSTNELGKLPIRTGIKLFDTVVKPIIEYGSELWSVYKGCNIMEKVHIKFLKMLLGVKSNTSNLMVYGDLGRFPLQLSYQCKIVKYIEHLQSMNETSLCKKMYNYLIKLNDSGSKTWINSVEQLLLEFDENLNVHNSFEKGKIAFRYKEYIYNKWHLEWKDNICNLERNPILRTYSQYKTELYLEPYLFNIKEYKLRKVISKFRMSSHMLEIERGRYKRPRVAPENRLCRQCDWNRAEDEIHFLLECPKYNYIRSVLVNKISQHYPMFLEQTKQEQFVFLLASKINQINKWLGKTLEAMFFEREKSFIC